MLQLELAYEPGQVVVSGKADMRPAMVIQVTEL